MTEERAAMKRTPVLLSEHGAVELHSILHSHWRSIDNEMDSTNDNLHAFGILENRLLNTGMFIKILEEAFPFLTEPDQ